MLERNFAIVGLSRGTYRHVLSEQWIASAKSINTYNYVPIMFAQKQAKSVFVMQILILSRIGSFLLGVGKGRTAWLSFFLSENQRKFINLNSLDFFYCNSLLLSNVLLRKSPLLEPLKKLFVLEQKLMNDKLKLW